MIPAGSQAIHMFQFDVNDKVYVRGQSQDTLFTVVERFSHDSGFPHYLLRGGKSKKLLRVSQLQLCRRKLAGRDNA